MPDLRAVLFDLDGTLIHSLDHIIECWQHTVRTCLGREITREEILPTLGRALLESFEELAPGRGAEMREIYRAYQKTTHNEQVKPVDGARPALDALRAAGFALGIVTSKSLMVAREGLDLFDLAPYFTTLVTYEDTTRHKPHPDPLLVASERMSLPPNEMLYVGDAVVDVLAGKAAGMQTAGVSWGASSLEAMRDAGADYLFTGMASLAETLTAKRRAASPRHNL